MKIFDCTTFYSEHMMMDVRFNILDKYVHKFVVVESLFSHSGEKKKLNFDINNYPKFKDKIIYLVIEKEPDHIINESSLIENQSIKRKNSNIPKSTSIIISYLSTYSRSTIFNNENSI